MKKTNTLIAFVFTFIFSNLNAQSLDVNFQGLNGNCGNYIGLTETQTLAQSFTAGISGDLTSVKVGISTDPCTETNSMNCVAKIYDGTCTGTVLTTENFTVPTGASLSMFSIDFSIPANIISGQMYVLELSVISGQNCIVSPFGGGMQPVFGRWHVENEFNCGGVYSGGTAYETGCSPYSADFYIQTWVVPQVVGVDTRTACDSYTWIDGNIYTESNNTATFNIVGGAANGSDSLVTLNLTINNVSDITTTLTGTTITANNNSATYLWVDCDNNHAIITGETNQTFTPSVNGLYAVILTENGCVDTSACVNITTAEIIENSLESQLSVYPNPIKGQLYIELSEDKSNTDVLISNYLGQEIFRKSYTPAKLIEISLEEEVAGIYFVEIMKNDMKMVYKLIKN